MTDAQKRLRELRDKQSRDRQKLIELSRVDELTDEQRSEIDTLEQGQADLERQLRAAQVAVDAEDAESRVEETETREDPETRERLELRSKVSLGRYLVAGTRGGRLDGAEAELAQAAGLAEGQIPLELWDVPAERRDNGGNLEQRAVTAAPATVGVNLDVLRPMVFAPSIVDKLAVDMPHGRRAVRTRPAPSRRPQRPTRWRRAAEVPETAAAFTVGDDDSASHRCLAEPQRSRTSRRSARPTSRACCGSTSRMVMSDELDDQLLTGDGQNDDLTGILQAVDRPGGAGGRT